MIALEKLAQQFVFLGMPEGSAERYARQFLSNYAHELAEKMRSWDAETAGYTDPQMAVYALADLIDPDVPLHEES